VAGTPPGGPQRPQGAPAPGDLVADASRREPVEALQMPIGVAADRHPGRQLLADQLGVALDLAANHEKGGRRLPLDQDGQDLGGAVGPGAVVEGQRHRQRPSASSGGVKGDRHQAARVLPSIQDGAGRTGGKRPHRVAGPAARKRLGHPGHRLHPAAATGHRDPVATVQASGCWCRVAVDQHLERVGALAQHAMVDRQQIPGHGRQRKASQGLLDCQAGRQRPGATLDHHGQRRPSKEQPCVGQGDQCGGQPQQQPCPAG
jgi:hypothetical protein